MLLSKIKKIIKLNIKQINHKKKLNLIKIDNKYSMELLKKGKNEKKSQYLEIIDNKLKIFKVNI